ncbi:MAG: threonine synthase [Bacteroidia bacterium]|nr:threonine synthase [Bacteroidia bacterium]
MYLYSTNNPQLRASLKEAVLKGLPQDKGLYMPGNIPVLPAEILQNLDQLSFPEIAFAICRNIFGNEIPDNDLEKIISHTLTFDAPLVSLTENTGVLELYHGPSLAFKDFGARFMSQLISWFGQKDKKETTILVATSGDTGGAVAYGFYKTPGVRVIILYPSGKVSDLQEKQLTTLGENITALEVEGNFDDCQAMVKQAFLDPALQTTLNLSSANSINIARLIPQCFYYFRAWQQIPTDRREKVVFSVPSGNFGNLTAGLMAQKMGLPVFKFIAATNINAIVPHYLRTGEFVPAPGKPTLSNAMDVGNPSNFARMKDLLGSDRAAMSGAIEGYSFTDEETRSAMKEIYRRYHYVMDPHGAVGWRALDHFLNDFPECYGVVLETAHPAKFLDVVNPVLGIEVTIPERLAVLADREKQSLKIGNQYEDLREILQNSR